MRRSVSACSTASGVPQTTTSPSLKIVSALGSRPTMPSRRTALTAACEPSVRELRDAAADRPRMRREDHTVKLFTKCMRVIEKVGARGTEILAQHAVPVAADVVHDPDDARNRQLEQQQHVR